MNEASPSLAKQNSRPRPIIKKPINSKNGRSPSSQASKPLRFSGDNQKPKSNVRNRTTKSQQKNRSEIDSLRDQVLNNPDLSEIENDQLTKLFPVLREYAHQKGAQQDYDEAQKAFDISEQVLIELKSRHVTTNNEEEVQGSFSSRQNQFEAEWERRFEEYDQKTEEKIQKLKEKQKEERDEFERAWNEDYPRRYRKPSAHLLQLKSIEKSYSVSCEFEKAKAIHAEAEALAQREYEIAQQNLFNDYNIALKQLNQKQQDDFENLIETRAHWRSIEKAKYDTEKTAYDKRSKVVVTRKAESEIKARRKPKPTGDFSGTDFTMTVPEQQNDVLLPPLRPPNDPELLEEESKRRKEENKKKLEYQKQNAQTTLSKYSVDGGDYLEESREEEAKRAKDAKNAPPAPTVSASSEMMMEDKNEISSEPVTDDENIKPSPSESPSNEPNEQQNNGATNQGILGNLAAGITDKLAD